MADPMTANPMMAAISLGAQVGGGIMQAQGQLAAGESANSAYQYRSAITKMNKDIAEQNADYAVKVGEVDAQREGMKTRAVVGGLRAKGGASGIDVNTGSKARVVESAEMVGEQNVAVARADAAKRAYGYRVEAENASAQGHLYEMAGQEELRASKLKAAGTLIGTASSVASKWSQASQAGVFSGGKSSGDGFDPWAGMREADVA